MSAEKYAGYYVLFEKDDIVEFYVVALQSAMNNSSAEVRSSLVTEADEKYKPLLLECLVIKSPNGDEVTDEDKSNMLKMVMDQLKAVHTM